MERTNEVAQGRLIYIPSYQRADMSKQTTARALNEAGIQFVMVVRRDEVDKYQSVMPKGTDFAVIDEPVHGIAETREWIRDRACYLMYKKFYMFDDDLRFFVRRSADPEDARLVKAAPSDLRDMMALLDKKLDHYGQVGVSCREGNNHVKQKLELRYQENARCIRAIGLNKEAAERVKYSEIEFKSDFDVTLQLLRQGFDNYVSFQWAQDHRTSNDKGGCFEDRTDDALTRCAYELHERHEPFVTVVKKTTKGSWGGGERTDVRVQWKKARASYAGD